MDAPKKKRTVTKRRRSIYDNLLEDSFVNDLCRDLQKQGAADILLTTLCAYIYELGYSSGNTAGLKIGREYGFKQACNHVERLLDERDRKRDKVNAPCKD